MESLEERVTRLETQSTNIQRDVAEIKSDTKEQNGKLDMLVAAENQRKGAKALGRIFLTTLGSGGFLGWLYEHFHK